MPRSVEKIIVKLKLYRLDFIAWLYYEIDRRFFSIDTNFGVLIFRNVDFKGKTSRFNSYFFCAINVNTFTATV